MDDLRISQDQPGLTSHKRSRAQLLLGPSVRCKCPVSSVQRYCEELWSAVMKGMH